MTKPDEAGSMNLWPASSIPSPPPALSSDEERVSRTIYSPVKQLWDIVTVYGPAARADLHAYRPTSNAHYREYIRFHPRIKADTSSATMLVAERWAFDRAIDHSLERGWLTQDDEGVIAAAQPPPGHTPLATIGGLSKLLTHLTSLDCKKALTILSARSNPARMKQDRRGRAKLEESIRRVGQLEPIVVWQPHPMSTADDVIVNGVARADILNRLGIPRERWLTRTLPPETPAVQVLLMRIEYDLAATSKDTTQDGHGAYRAQLLSANIDHAALAERFRAAVSKVERITSDVAAEQVSISPTDTEIDEFLALRDGGWALRDIEDRTQWSKSTIERTLAHRDAINAGQDLTTLMKVGSNRARLFSALAVAGKAGARAVSLPEILLAAGYPPGRRQGPDQRKMLEEWEELALVTRSGRGTNRDAFTYRPTRKGMQEFDRLQLAGEPAPVAAPAAAVDDPLAKFEVEVDEELNAMGLTWDDLVKYRSRQQREPSM